MRENVEVREFTYLGPSITKRRIHIAKIANIGLVRQQSKTKANRLEIFERKILSMVIHVKIDSGDEDITSNFTKSFEN